ncbi:MAG: MATE family efflux transporter, partial [Desulfovibrionales bacterium]
MPAHTFEQEFEQAPTRTIWRIAWPQVLMMVFHFLIGFVDVWVAGRLGREIQATIGLITQALFFFMVVANALANGSVAAISQSAGSGKVQRIRRYIGLSLQLGFFLSGAIMLVGLLIKDTLLALLQVPPSIEPVA